MIVAMTAGAPASATEAVLAAARAAGLEARAMSDGHGGALVGIHGTLDVEALRLSGIAGIQPKHKPYMLASREHRPHAPTVVKVGDVRIGGGRPVVMAGPCVVEGRETLLETAIAVKVAGADMLRGGAFKPRTSPYSFQGLGEAGLQHLAAARDATGLPVVTEVMEPESVDLVANYADMLQIGSRNMANFPLLRRAGQTRKPILLKRGFSATVEEWLMSAEYILAAGNPNVILCERGIRGFDPAFRFTLDLNAVPLLRELTHLPVIVDPSHGTGKRSLVSRMAMAGLAAGADGLMIEVHPDPEGAMCDGSQTITPADLSAIIRSGRALQTALLDAALDSDATPVESPVVLSA
ncbi:MAG: 3-deoxy-7-phosphoheptulonate synthase [Chloroflexota bacterium]|nr:3-deoxy-7-phosphoheptulonate synthase [Chloroflexota bacterium]